MINRVVAVEDGYFALGAIVWSQPNSAKIFALLPSGHVPSLIVAPLSLPAEDDSGIFGDSNDSRSPCSGLRQVILRKFV